MWIVWYLISVQDVKGYSGQVHHVYKKFTMLQRTLGIREYFYHKQGFYERIYYYLCIMHGVQNVSCMEITVDLVLTSGFALITVVQ